MSTVRTLVYTLCSVLVMACASYPKPEVPGELWEYTCLGSSVGTFWTGKYAALLERDLQVKLHVHNYYVGNQRLRHLLATVQGDPVLRENLSRSKVITVGIGFADIHASLEGVSTGEASRKAFADYVHSFQTDYRELLAEIRSLSPRGMARVSLIDFYFPYLARYPDPEIRAEVLRRWQALNRVIVQEGRRQRIPVAPIFSLFNGEEGGLDPVARALIAGDGLHPSEQGLSLMARAVRELYRR